MLIYEVKFLVIDISLVLILVLKSIKENIEKLYLLIEKGIYFIGFDVSYVGFLLNKVGKIYFIYFNYLDVWGVMIEWIEEFEVFVFYGCFYLVLLSGN